MMVMMMMVWMMLGPLSRTLSLSLPLLLRMGKRTRVGRVTRPSWSFRILAIAIAGPRVVVFIPPARTTRFVMHRLLGTQGVRVDHLRVSVSIPIALSSSMRMGSIVMRHDISVPMPIIHHHRIRVCQRRRRHLIHRRRRWCWMLLLAMCSMIHIPLLPLPMMIPLIRILAVHHRSSIHLSTLFPITIPFAHPISLSFPLALSISPTTTAFSLPFSGPLSFSLLLFTKHTTPPTPLPIPLSISLSFIRAAQPQPHAGSKDRRGHGRGNRQGRLHECRDRRDGGADT